jgi:mannose-6-phosphate isomerase-like protein (cupin superfamily)
MNGYIDNIEKLSLENNNFRKVLYTAKHSQLVLMSLAPGEEIGMEVHPDQDQFLRIEKGTGKAVVDGVEHALEDGSAVIVPAGAQHNIVNASSTEPLKLYTIYSPPHHRDGVVHETKTAAEADNEEFDGKTTE